MFGVGDFSRGIRPSTPTQTQSDFRLRHPIPRLSTDSYPSLLTSSRPLQEMPQVGTELRNEDLDFRNTLRWTGMSINTGAF